MTIKPTVHVAVQIGLGVALIASVVLVSLVFTDRSLASSHIEPILQQNPTPTSPPTPTPITRTESWRLPFEGQRRIFHGPGQGNHQGLSSEATDFLLAANPPVTYPILAVADGTVIDVINDEAFGTVLRINHPRTNSCSFYAHLNPITVQVSPGNNVAAGQYIADAGQSGTGSNGEIHLHFEARNQCIAGNVFSGNSIPLRAVMGVWWSPWYAPPPAFSEDPNRNSGRAEYPPNATPPTEMWDNGARHLSNSDSPTNFASAYVSNINSSQIVLHRGASPDVSGGATDAYFETRQFLDPQGWGILPDGGGHGPTYMRILNVAERCGSNGQFCFAIRSAFQAGGTFTSPRYVDIHAGNVSIPYISASYNLSESTVFLTYSFPNALRYRVYEYHGGEQIFVYEGLSSQLTINRIVGAVNGYSVTVDLGQAGWTQSAWVYLHDEAVVIPTNTPTPTNTLTPTPTPDDTIFADSFESGNLSAWSSNVNNGGDLSVTTAAALSGGYGLQAVINDNTAIYVHDESPSTEARYRARFSFDPNTITMANGNAHFIFLGYSGTGTTTQVVRVEFRRSSNNYQIRASLRNDGTGWTHTSWFTITDAPHYIEFDWQADTAVDPNPANGRLTLWIDDVQKADLTGIDNDTRRIERVSLGAVNGIDSGTRGTYYFDAFFSRRLNTIGAPLKDELKGYWKLEEASGTRVDATGRGNDLADNNTVGQTTGKVGSAAQFVAIDYEYLSHADHSDLSSGDIDFSVVAWVNLSSKGPRTIVTKWNGYINQAEYSLYYSSSGDRFRFAVSPNGITWSEAQANALGSPA